MLNLNVIIISRITNVKYYHVVTNLRMHSVVTNVNLSCRIQQYACRERIRNQCDSNEVGIRYQHRKRFTNLGPDIVSKQD